MYMWHVITYVIMNCNLVILTSGYMEREVVVKHSIRCKKLIKKKTIWQILEHLNVSLKTWNLLNLCLSLSLSTYVYIYTYVYDVPILTDWPTFLEVTKLPVSAMRTKKKNSISGEVNRCFPNAKI